MRKFIAAAAAFICLALPAWAQTPKEVAGTYWLEHETRESNGVKSEVHTNGVLMLDGTGHYTLMTIARGLPKITSNNRMTATPEESKAITAGVVAHYGSYAVSGDTLIFNIERASFPNWDGTEQKRPFTLAGDDLTTRAVSSGGGSVTLNWKRAK